MKYTGKLHTKFSNSTGHYGKKKGFTAHDRFTGMVETIALFSDRKISCVFSRSPRRRAEIKIGRTATETGIFRDNKHVILMMQKPRRPWTKPP
jgi:hypothetical protein